MGQYYGIVRSSEYLAHYGVLGMRWGIRKAPGSSGRRSFISGSSKTQDRSSPYFRRRLPKDLRKYINKGIKNGDTFIVGDAPGIDRQVQDYLKRKHYSAVDVYGPGKKVRYSADPKWKTHPIDSKYPEGSKQWLAKKDREMARDSTQGYAVVLDHGGASATRKNISRMHNANKHMRVYELNPNTGLIKGFPNSKDKNIIIRKRRT